MVVKRIIRVFKTHFQNYFLYYFILSLCLIIGIIIGPLLINLFGLNTKVFILKNSNPYYKTALLNNHVQNSLINISILNSIYLILFIYLLSILNISLLIVPIIILIKGITLGYTVGFLVNSFGLKGFLLSIGGIYPQNIFIISGLIGLGAVSMSLTKIYRRPLSNQLFHHGSRNLNEILMMAGVYSFVIIFGAIIEGIISPSFLSLTLDFFV